MASRMARARRRAYFYGMRALFLAIVGLSGAGCMGVYAEANATAYPSFHHAEGDATPKPVRAEGAGYALGFSVGFELDGRRTHRIALGFNHQGTNLPGEGYSNGGQSEVRADIGLARPTKSSRLRLGMGFGLGVAKVRMSATDGTTLSERRTNGQVFAGPVFAQYFGKRHSLSVMGAVSYFAVGAPGGGSVTATGLGARVTWSFHFDDTRPSSASFTPIEGGKNLLDLVDVGARRLGCTSRYVERREAGGLTESAVFASCPPHEEEVVFLQTADGILVECPHLEDSECQAMTARIIESAKAKAP